MLSNAYFLAKFRFDTAENEPAKLFLYTISNICQICQFCGADLGVAAGVLRAEGGPVGLEGAVQVLDRQDLSAVRVTQPAEYMLFFFTCDCMIAYIHNM